MSQVFFIAAALGCFLGGGFHGVVGRRIYLANIRAAALPARTVSLSTVAWDTFTVMLAVSGLTLLCVAFNPMALWMAYPIMLMLGLGAAIFALLAVAGHKDLIRLPGGYLQAVIALLIFLGL